MSSSVDFFANNFGYFHWLNESNRHKHLSALTFAFVETDDGCVVFALAKCNEEDQFSRKKGRWIAGGRLAHALPYYNSVGNDHFGHDPNLRRPSMDTSTGTLSRGTTKWYIKELAKQLAIPSTALQKLFDIACEKYAWDATPSLAYATAAR